MKRVLVRYVAMLKEQAGRESEWIETDGPSAAGLYEEVRRRHGFRIDPKHLRVAVNDRFAAMDVALDDNDEVMFLPPVAGG
jgi:molybdopterin synthase sulfur carrier subunit